MSAIIKFCVVLWLIYRTDGQIARCDYIYKYHWTTGYKTTNASYYRCDLDTEQANYNTKLRKIDGKHLNGHSDADVKYIGSYIDDKLKTFSSIFCQKFPNLEIIDMSDAEVESIDEDSLSNCENLDKLILYGNKIRELPENFLIRNSKLTYFWVKINQLTTLPENLFLNQKELESLNLGENQINFLPSNIFRPLVKLEELYLYYNKLQSINPEWFVTLQKLKWLGLHGNQISEIPSKSFFLLRNLEELFLYKNRIKTLKSDNFDGLQNLQILNLKVNEISDLPVGVFTPLRNLQELSLRNNKLTTINSDSFDIHNQLINVWLQDNKINSIDPKFIDNTAVSLLTMINNVCNKNVLRSRAEIKNHLSDCFANYQPRPIQVQSSCGRSIIPQGNIYGGTQIKLGSYPWIAALLRRKDRQFFCGGTLVSNRKIVTAAHCLKDKGSLISMAPNRFNVLLGFHNLDNPSEAGRLNSNVQSVNIHPDWSSHTYSYDADIAVLVLTEEVQFTNRIQPICMNSADSRIASALNGIVVGNGKSSEDNHYENIPKIIKMPVQSSEICMKKDFMFKQLSSGRTFCAGNADGTGVCSGDSGAGFMVKIDTAYYLRGTVSASLGDPMLGCDVNSFAVFTDATKFIDWINGIPIVSVFRKAPVEEDRVIFTP